MEVESRAAETDRDESQLLRWRDRFPILSTTTYLISNSLGAMPDGVYDSLRGYADTWATRGVRAWEDEWWNLAGGVGDRIAAILGAAPGSVSTHQNVTIASAVIASCFDFSGERNRIVCSDLNFPSVIYLYRNQERHGAELELVPSEDGVTVPLDRMLEAIDERTALVPISHVIFRSSWVQDVDAIVARAHEVGARVALDTYQSVGIMPVDVTALGVDFAVGGVLKWLCGGPGVGYLYVRPDLAETLRPALTGWFARERSFDFDPYDDSYAAGSRHFINGTTHIPSLSAALPGLEILGSLDLRAVRAKSIRQTDRIVAAADERGWKLSSPRDAHRRAGHVTVAPPGADRVATEMLERGVLIDYRPGAGIRLAPHFYTTDDEVDRALEVMAQVAR